MRGYFKTTLSFYFRYESFGIQIPADRAPISIRTNKKNLFSFIPNPVKIAHF